MFDLATIRSASRPNPAASITVVELRQYGLRPRQRDVLIGLFERELVEPQERVGMKVIGQFVDRDDPDRFVWLRGFADMRSRREALAAFYEGPVWQTHRGAANATMVDSGNVLLLRPARDDASFDLDGERPAGGAGVVGATIAYLDTASAESTAVEAFESKIAPAIAARGGAVLGYFLTEPSRNDFPRLPVREGERVLIWFVGFPEASALEEASESIESAVDASMLPVSGIEQLVLVPTTRSLLSGRTAPARP